MTDLKSRLRDRCIAGMYGNSDPNDWSIELNEGVDPLCIEAADEIERLERNLAKAREDALAKCVAACESNRAIEDMDYPENDVYNQAVNECIEAITRALKEKP